MLRIIVCSIIGIVSHAAMTIVMHERYQDSDTLEPALMALLMAVTVEVVAWEVLRLIFGG